MRLEIAESGEVRGTVEGPLGPADVVGTVEGARVLATVSPRGDGTDAFAGTLQGRREGELLTVQVRASDGAAVAVRSADASLAR